MNQRTRLPITLYNGRYRLLRQLGRGRMGVVYQAIDELLQRDVAVKFLVADQFDNEAAFIRFEREARAIAKLKHPNIMTVYDIGREGEWPFLILEYIDGFTLDYLIHETKEPITPQQAAPLMHSMLAGVAHAHQQGIIHRDLKPANIMLTTTQQIKIADFGLASVPDEVQITQAGMIVGTMRYLAPELLNGQAADARTDLYALGAIFYELLTQEPPFPQKEMTSLMWHIAHEPVSFSPTPHKQIPEVLKEIILRLLEKDPDQRYQTAAEVLNALAHLEKPISTAEGSSTRLLVERLTARPLSTTAQALLDQALAADHTAALEVERRHLAQRIQEQVIEPLNLLLSQTTAYHHSLATNPQAKMALSVLTTLVKQTLQQSRDLEGDLHPAVLESLGLEPALETLANQLIRTHGVQVTLQFERLAERLSPTMELLLFRTTQELVQQAIHHGRANHIIIQLQLQETQLIYQLNDNGLAERPLLSPITAAQLQHEKGSISNYFSPTTGCIWKITFQQQPAVELTRRELETIQLLAQGLSNKEIAAQMSVTPRTVNFHLDNIYSKLGVSSRTEAAVIALQKGWIA